jgi:hypothetical protein
VRARCSQKRRELARRHHTHPRGFAPGCGEGEGPAEVAEIEGQV